MSALISEYFVVNDLVKILVITIMVTGVYQDSQMKHLTGPTMRMLLPWPPTLPVKHNDDSL